MKKKVIRLEDHQPAKEIFTNRLPLAQFREIWNDQTITYTDEQLIRIREWLYVLTEVITGTVNENPHLIIELNIKQYGEEESIPLYEESKKRRA